MTYYEELGVEPTAPVEEIRRAYKRLARLMHPDRQTGEETRRLAEMQMKRLNGMLEVLVYEAARAKYDESLRGTAVPQARPSGIDTFFWKHGRLVAGAFALPFAFGLGLTLWPRPVLAPQPATPPPPPPARTAPLTKPRSLSLRPKGPVAMPAANIEPPPDPAVPSLPEIPAGIAAIPVAIPSPPQPELSRPVTLSGNWLLAGPVATQQGEYPPEYIELRLAERSGILHGRYQARYRVADRAISPNVAFRFDGHAGPEGGVLQWQGPGGAAGDVTLQLLPDGGLKVDWVARQLGRELRLISGTSTLVRKRD
jgi:hypothetical protein